MPWPREENHVLRNCPDCGRLLTTPPGVPCAECLQEEDTAVARITAYLEAGGVPSLAMVARGTGIKTRLLRRLAHSGRVLLNDSGVPGGACAICGRTLTDPGGRVCAQCARRMTPGGVAPSGGPGRPTAETRPGRRGFYSQHGGGEA